MNKQAYERCVGSVISKTAGSISDRVYGALSSTALLPLAPLQAVGSGVAYMSDPGTPEQSREENDRFDVYRRRALLPGVSGYRVAKRRINQANAGGSKSPRARALAESLGPATATLISTLLGSAVGAGAGYLSSKGDAADRKNKMIAGALGGALTGGTLATGAHLIGSIASGLTPTRTNSEQAAHDRDASLLADYIIPGVGAYNSYKALGNQIANSNINALTRVLK